jgi:hypothetical protein
MERRAGRALYCIVFFCYLEFFRLCVCLVIYALDTIWHKLRVVPMELYARRCREGVSAAV